MCGCGVMIVVELVKFGIIEFDVGLIEWLVIVVYVVGVIILICGMFGNIIWLLLLLIIGDELLSEGLDIVCVILVDF